MNTISIHLMRFNKLCLVAASFLLLSGSINAQSAEKIEKTKVQSTKKVDKTHQYSLTPVAPASNAKPVSAVPATEMKQTKATQAPASVTSKKSTDAKLTEKGSLKSQEQVAPELSTKNVSLKPSAGSDDKSIPSREEQLAVKKQKYAESLRSRGFPEAEVSKMVNSKFPDNQSASKK